MSENMKNSPKLRFPEFVNDGEWEEKKISDVCEKPYSGGTPSSTVKEYYGGNIPFIRSAEIDKVQTELFLTNEGLKNSSAKFVKKGDVLIALYGANSGDVAISKIEGAINQAILCLNSKDSNSFLYQYLVLKKDWIVAKYIQGGQGNLSGEIIKSIELKFPKQKEQQKIADCLSSVDSLISAQSKKVELLKEHKKALMQQLFPQDTEEVPKLRFPEFKNAPKWCKANIEELFRLKQGMQCGVENQFYEKIDGYIRFIRIIDLTSNSEPVRFIKDPGAEHHINEDDLFMVRYGVAGLVGYGYKGVIANNLFRFIPIKKTKVHNKFFYFLFNFISSSFEQLAGSSTMPALNFKSLNTLALLFPSTIDEQQKIADCLSSIDEQIGSQAKKSQTLKERKKALMQQLFPSKEVEI